ncbi:ornithine decarboxylase antizyme-domain-containing protein [Clohesyomyces aquaticus]|uniref:Ornithine decarboxylase antizyme n=1 Tax=Clohesyomyces aquaticus TaxID=1231657 RepID=A0A1Y2A0J3_9PLEO|nr:ornithine decarboxylase antizyme-domain-containing protein [Clohesyomyces aquaticus]
MARISTSTHNSSSSNPHGNYYAVNENVRASCYAVNTCTTAIQGFHYSTTGAGGGSPSPPLSPPLAARHTSTAKSHSMQAGGRARRGGAAYTITEECERLFCETLRAVFLGEGNLAGQDSLVLGVQNQNQHQNHDYGGSPDSDVNDYGVDVRSYTSADTDSTHASTKQGIEHEKSDTAFDDNNDGVVTDYLEIWDYVGGNKFRGFVVDKDGERSMFVFFDKAVMGADLKAGYVSNYHSTPSSLTKDSLMALLELCDTSYFSCVRLVACLDRQSTHQTLETMAKDLGWIGFQLTTLNDFTRGEDIVSDKWLFMDVEV